MHFFRSGGNKPAGRVYLMGERHGTAHDADRRSPQRPNAKVTGRRKNGANMTIGRNKLRREAAIPLYLQARDLVLRRILSGELAPGAKLPSDRQMSALLGVNQITLRKAMNMLRDEGWLVRFPGHGTHVAEALPRREEPSRRSVAVLFDSVNEQTFMSSLFVSLFRNLDAAGLSLNLISAEGSPELQRRRLEEILTSGEHCGCLLWSILNESAVQSALERRPPHFPLVFMDHCPAGHPCDWSGYDDYAAAWQLGHAMAAQGCRQGIICRSTAENSWSTAPRRRTGFADGFGLPCQEYRYAPGNPAEARAGLRNLLDGLPGKAALFCVSNMECEDLEATAPVPDADFCFVCTAPRLPIRKVSLNVPEMGANAVAILLERLNGNDAPQLVRQASWTLEAFQN